MEELTTPGPLSAARLPLYLKKDLSPSLLFRKSMLMPLRPNMPPLRPDLSPLPSFVLEFGRAWLFVSGFYFFFADVIGTMARSELRAPVSSSCMVC